MLEAGPANTTAAAPVAPPQPDTPAWTAMVLRIKNLESVCRAMTQKWQCNAGTQKCVWDDSQVRFDHALWTGGDKGG
jgi:hypothetical protein